MARGRMLNRKVATSLSMHQLPDDTCRLLATWLIPFLDKRGVFYADPAIVRSTVFPRRADLSIERVEFYMQAIEAAGMVTIFEADGQRWQLWPKFLENQIGLRDDREATDFPPPPAATPDKPASQSGKNPERIRKASREKPAEEKRSEVNRSEDEGEVNAAPAAPSDISATVTPAPTHPPPPSVTAPAELRSQPKPATQRQAAKREDGQKSEPAILAYASVFRVQPNPAQRAAILREVTDVPRWGKACQEWALKGYKPGNVEGMLEVYRDGWRIAVKDWPGAGKASKNGKTFIRPQVADSTDAEREAEREAARKRIAERAARKGEQ